MNNFLRASCSGAKNFFPLPNAIFSLGLSAGELAVYAYLMYCEDRKSHQCWPSYKTIGRTVGMSENTVRKYVRELAFAGVQLRLECAEIMKNQGHEEPTGGAKITDAYNLPCDRILHTVGPVVSGNVKPEDEQDLKDCYISCLEVAKENSIKSVAFCCISTGVFRFPNRLAAEIAVETVPKYKDNVEVVFNVFKDSDYKIYQELLSGT